MRSIFNQSSDNTNNTNDTPSSSLFNLSFPNAIRNFALPSFTNNLLNPQPSMHAYALQFAGFPVTSAAEHHHHHLVGSFSNSGDDAKYGDNNDHNAVAMFQKASPSYLWSSSWFGSRGGTDDVNGAAGHRITRPSSKSDRGPHHRGPHNHAHQKKRRMVNMKL